MFHGCFTKDREESYDLGYDSTALQYITVATYYCPKVYSNQKIFSDLEKKMNGARGHWPGSYQEDTTWHATVSTSSCRLPLFLASEYWAFLTTLTSHWTLAILGLACQSMLVKFLACETRIHEWDAHISSILENAWRTIHWFFLHALCYPLASNGSHTTLLHIYTGASLRHCQATTTTK